MKLLSLILNIFLPFNSSSTFSSRGQILLFFIYRISFHSFETLVLPQSSIFNNSYLPLIVIVLPKISAVPTVLPGVFLSLSQMLRPLSNCHLLLVNNYVCQRLFLLFDKVQLCINSHNYSFIQISLSKRFAGAE